MMMIYINSLVKYQSFKQLVFNTDDPDSIQDMQLGPADALVNPTREGNGNVQVLDLQARVMELYDLVKHRTMTVLSGYGIAPDNFTMSASPTFHRMPDMLGIETTNQRWRINSPERSNDV